MTPAIATVYRLAVSDHPRLTKDQRLAVGERIKELREKKGWTQDVLGDRAGVRGQQVWRIENGSFPEADTLLLIAHAFGVAPDWLLWGSGPRIESNVDPLDAHERVRRDVDAWARRTGKLASDPDVARLRESALALALDDARLETMYERARRERAGEPPDRAPSPAKREGTRDIAEADAERKTKRAKR